MKITYYGHSCFGIYTSGVNLLFDPFIKGNPLAKAINISEIKADYIFISHGHFDHIADAIEIAKNNNATVISNFEIVNWLTSQGVEKTHSINLGGKFITNFGKVKYLAAIHSSSLPDGSYGGCAGGFLIESLAGKFYFAGDTGLSYDMKLIGEYVKLDFAILPIGNNFTMGVDNAMIAAEYIKCNKIIGMHYNTFPVIKINTSEAIEKFDRNGMKLTLMAIGQSLELNKIL